MRTYRVDDLNSSVRNLKDMIDVVCDYQFEYGEAKAQVIDSLLWVARDLADGIVANLDRVNVCEPSAVEAAIAAYHAAEAAWRPHELSEETAVTKALFDAKEDADNAVMIAPCHSLEDVRAKARLCFSDENVMDSLQNCTWANERVLTQFLRSVLGEARGWNKYKVNSPKREEGEIKNLELWQAINAALQNLTAGQVMIKWVKGHIGVAGNERADELAEQGREQVEMRADLLTSSDDLDQRYRQIMGAA